MDIKNIVRHYGTANPFDIADKKGIEYERINPFDNPEIAVKYKIRSVPTVILFEENEEVKRTIGFKPEEINEIISMM